ncbi:MAG: hypothetical protein GY832_20080 [Chloroflexi bacterium]|nr:hypothetical protein [Chloroflexota bacterium]
MATRRKPMQVSIENILQAHGKLEAFQQAFRTGGTFYLKLEKECYQPLVIERVDSDRVAISHFFIQNGDVMRDPEIVFSYDPSQPVDFQFWPVEITQHPVGVYRRKFFERDGRKMVDTSFHSSVSPLVKIWAKNLKFQGWEKAKITGEEIDIVSILPDDAELVQLSLF